MKRIPPAHSGAFALLTFGARRDSIAPRVGQYLLRAALPLRNDVIDHGLIHTQTPQYWHGNDAHQHLRLTMMRPARTHVVAQPGKDA
jgi:hypothetical protein